MEKTPQEVQAAIALILELDAKRRLARFLGAENPRDCLVPGHAWGIGEQWVGPSYEEWWANGAWQKAGLNGACQCGWQGPAPHGDLEHWVDHLAACDIDWDEVEREYTLRGLGKLPNIVARVWHRP